MRHITSVLLENEPGALSRVVGLFSARGYNIEMLTVVPTEDASLSCMTIVTTGLDDIIEQITKHLNRLVEVVKAVDLTEGAHIERELMLVKVCVVGREREEMKRTADIFRGRIINVTEKTYTIELTGNGSKLDAFLDAIDRTAILETVRIGDSDIGRGERILKVWAGACTDVQLQPDPIDIEVFENQDITTKVFYDRDVDLSLIRGRNVTIVGYGPQSHAHALNLNDSGVKVTVGPRKNGASWNKAVNAGLQVKEVAETVKEADVVMILLPDEQVIDVYKNGVHNSIKQGATLTFARGFNVHYGAVIPRADLNVIMITPKASGHTVRGMYTRGGDASHLIVVHQDKSGAACDIALSYTTASGGGRAGIIETNFRGETETDLFGEQAVLCGGTVELTKVGFKTLVEAGCTPEMAYFECLRELELTVDLVYEGGIANINYSISSNAECDEYVTGPRVVTEETERAMKQCLKDIQTSEYVKSFLLGYKAGQPTPISRRRLTEEYQIEQVGAKLRAMMPWIAKNKLVDQSKN